MTAKEEMPVPGGNTLLFSNMSMLKLESVKSSTGLLRLNVHSDYLGSSLTADSNAAYYSWVFLLNSKGYSTSGL